MAGSDANVRRPPAMYYNPDSSMFEDADSSVCGVVYITSEGGAHKPKQSHNHVLQQQQPNATARHIIGRSQRLLVRVAYTVGVMMLLALGTGIAVGETISVVPSWQPMLLCGCRKEMAHALHL
eukprot:GHRQ01035978.1.p1 GENE.GHRQ01035978.1~~GHRQ01035978.1.p1  ORF type:complete len:123 (-),score=11.84 GHRQ01035978.1:247-615(-)